MQDYIHFAQKQGVRLIDSGPCQFCGAGTTRGVHECVEIFSLGFQSIDYADPANHLFRFLTVDAHTLQHPELHGRWNNHFHLSRLHLIFEHQVRWTYQLSPRLSDHLNRYKAQHPSEVLAPPPVLERGTITSTDVLAVVDEPEACKKMIDLWAREVYHTFSNHHQVVAGIAKSFL